MSNNALPPTTPTRKRKPKVDEMDETVVNESLTRQIATYLLTNASIADCAKTLGISASSVRTICDTPRYKELVADVAQAELAPALAKAKAQLARLSTKAVAAIERALDEGSARDALQAATIVLKSVGMHEEKEQQQDNTINIIMPFGMEQVVTYETKEED